jgi:hypothetical protein
MIDILLGLTDGKGARANTGTAMCLIWRVGSLTAADPNPLLK